MSRGLTDDFKELVRGRTDLLALVSETVAMRPQRGGRDYVGLCPFHDDRNPSMHVYTDRQNFRCWSCQEGGDCFTFVMKRDRVGFREALELLAQRAGIELPEKFRITNGPTVDAKLRMYETVAWAERQFHEYLLEAPQAERARGYLKSRGISADSILRFRLGFHPDEWEWLISRARGQYSIADLQQVRLVRERDGNGGFYDCFVDRVLFPIRDPQRRPVAFGGRILPDSRYQNGGKYINSDDYPLFHKSKLVYAMDEARDAISKSKQVVVTEGYTDCIISHQYGLKNVVATLGTALNENHVSLLKRFAHQVVLMFDGDAPGQNATEKALIKFLSQDVDLRTLTLPGNQDPADFLLASGADALRSLLDHALEAWDYKYRVVMQRHGLDSIDSRHRVLQEMIEVLAEVPAPTGMGMASKWMEREQIILGRLAQNLKLSESFIRDRLRDFRSAEQQRGRAPRLESPQPNDESANSTIPEIQIPPLPSRPTRDERAELDAVMCILTHPACIEQFVSLVSPADFSHLGLRQLFELSGMLFAKGELPSYERLSLNLESEHLMRLIVQVDELARSRNPSDDLIQQTLAWFRYRRELEAHATDPVHELAEDPVETTSPDGTTDSLDELAKERLRRAMQLVRTRHRRSNMLTPPGEPTNAPT